MGSGSSKTINNVKPVNNSSSGFINKASNFFKNLTSSNSNQVSNSLSNSSSLTNRIKNISNDVLLIIIFVFFIAMLVYLLLILNRPSMLHYTLAPRPIKVNKDSIKPLDNSDKLPSLKNGREFAYSFWVYLEGVENMNSHRLVFMRSPGADGAYMVSANPIVYLDKSSNRMIIKLRTSMADQMGVNATTLDSPLNSSTQKTDTGEVSSIHTSNCEYATFKIDYIPLQRWTNVIVNVDNNVVTVFLDGDIHSTRILNENNQQCASDMNKVISTTTGNVLVGNIPDDIPAMNGYVSRLMFFNYSIKNPEDITKIYEDGPIEASNVVNQLLQKTGINEYGVRSPFYRVDGLVNQEV